MGTKNVQAALSVYDAFNRRDFDAAVAPALETVRWTDQARGITFKSRDEVRDQLLKGWAGAFSDGQITEPNAYDAGDTVIVTFIGRGTNDGPLGPLEPTGRRASVSFCDVIHFDQAGRIIAGDTYYDQLTLLTQLGHAEPMAL